MQSCTYIKTVSGNTILIQKQLEYLDSLREAFGVTPTELARKSGVVHTTITRFISKRGPHALGSKTISKIEKAFHRPFYAKIEKVKVVGYVGAGGSVSYFADGDVLEEIEAPAEAAEAGVEALLVQGDSMYPVYRNGEYIYILKQGEFDPSYIGHDCVIELEDGRVLLKTLKHGVQANRYTLSSYNAPDIENVALKSATPVRWSKKF